MVEIKIEKVLLTDIKSNPDNARDSHLNLQEVLRGIPKAENPGEA